MNKPTFKKTPPGHNLCTIWHDVPLQVLKIQKNIWRVWYNDGMIYKLFPSRWLAARWAIKYAVARRKRGKV